MNKLYRAATVVRSFGKEPWVKFDYKGPCRIQLNDDAKTEVLVSSPGFTYNNGKIRFTGYQTTPGGLAQEVSYEVHPDSMVGFGKC